MPRITRPQSLPSCKRGSTEWCVRCCPGSGSGRRNCCNGWRTPKSATNEPCAHTKSAAPPVGHLQASLPKAVVVILVVRNLCNDGWNVTGRLPGRIGLYGGNRRAIWHYTHHFKDVSLLESNTRIADTSWCRATLSRVFKRVHKVLGPAQGETTTLLYHIDQVCRRGLEGATWS